MWATRSQATCQPGEPCLAREGRYEVHSRVSRLVHRLSRPVRLGDDGSGVSPRAGAAARALLGCGGVSEEHG